MNSLVCMTIRARSRFEREIIRTLDGSEPARASSLRCEVVDDYQRQIRIFAVQQVSRSCRWDTHAAP